MSCKNGHLDVAKWLYEIGNKYNNPIDIHIYYYNYDSDDDDDDDLEGEFYEEQAFRYSLYNNHIDVAKWLYQISIETNSPINIHAMNDEAFKDSCGNGNLVVAKWLYQIGIETNKPIKFSVCKYVLKRIRKMEI